VHTEPTPQPPACAAIPAVGGVVRRTGVGLVAAAPVSLPLIRGNGRECECGEQGDCGERQAEEYAVISLSPTEPAASGECPTPVVCLQGAEASRPPTRTQAHLLEESILRAVQREPADLA
jgi:hypothetical protein